MFRPIIYTFVLLLSFASFVSASDKLKEVSIFGGSNLAYPINDEYIDNLEFPKFNLDLGIHYSHNIYSRIYLVSGIEFDYNIIEHTKHNDRYDDDYEEYLYFSYLYIPIYLKINMAELKKLDIYTSFGYKFGYLLKSIVNFRYDSGHQSGMSIYDESEAFSNSYQQNLGFSYKITKFKDVVQLGMFMEIGYKYTFTKTMKYEDFRIASSKLTLGLKGSWK